MEESGDAALADNPTTWVKRDFERWKRNGKPSRLNVPIVTNVSTTGPPATTAGEKQQKIDDNKLQSWNKGTKSAKDYPLLENDEYYTEWIVKMIRQIKLDTWERLIDMNFDTKTIRAGSNSELYTLQGVFMSTVLEKVLVNIHGLKLVRSFEDDPKSLWRKYEEHQRSSSSSQRIAIVLSNRLSNMTIATAKSSSAFLEDFNKSVTKFNKVSADKMPES